MARASALQARGRRFESYYGYLQAGRLVARTLVLQASYRGFESLLAYIRDQSVTVAQQIVDLLAGVQLPVVP